MGTKQERPGQSRGLPRKYKGQSLKLGIGHVPADPIARPIDRGHRDPADAEAPPPTTPWFDRNPEFADREFFDEYMAILAENRAIATAEAIAGAEADEGAGAVAEADRR